MITSALISQCRREFGDEPKSMRVQRAGNGSVNLFNVGKFPIVEGSYTVYLSGATKTENTDYTIDLENGDIRMLSTPANGVPVTSQHQYAAWTDASWKQAINGAIDELNARGFYRTVERTVPSFKLSANIQVFSAPSACIDIYQLLVSDNGTTSGNYVKPNVNWRYIPDTNKLVLGSKPSSTQALQLSYLRKIQTYSASSATIDLPDEWIGMVKARAGEKHYRFMAGKIAKMANANVDEGHFSFTNLRTMANDLSTEFTDLAKRKKPARPSRDLQFNVQDGGTA